jgi:DnaJ family protein C protein 28
MPNVEDLIKKAMQEGKFDNLPGKGKKIRMENINPHADPEWELVYGMLKDAGYTLPWIETRNEIEADIESARQDLQRAWKWRIIYLSADVPEEKASVEWYDACAAFREKIPSLNKRIRDYNLQVPALRFQRTVLNYEDELKQITSM